MTSIGTWPSPTDIVDAPTSCAYLSISSNGMSTRNLMDAVGIGPYALIARRTRSFAGSPSGVPGRYTA